jgi:hypothetical protein
MKIVYGHLGGQPLLFAYMHFVDLEPALIGLYEVRNAQLSGCGVQLFECINV